MTKKVKWYGKTPFPINPTDHELTIADGKAILEETFRTGKSTPCLCCGQDVMPYPRPIYSSMVKALKFLYHKATGTPRQLTMATNGGGDYRKLAEWGFLQFLQGSEKEPNRYALTAQGRRFYEGRILVPRRLYWYRAEVWGESVEQCHITDCVDEDFDFGDMMSPRHFDREPAE